MINSIIILFKTTKLTVQTILTYCSLNFLQTKQLVSLPYLMYFYFNLSWYGHTCILTYQFPPRQSHSYVLVIIFYLLTSHRMKGKKTIEHQAAVKELEQSIHMVKAPLAMQQEPSLTLPKTKVKVSVSHSESYMEE